MKRFYLFLMEQHPMMIKFIAGGFVIAGLFFLLEWMVSPTHIIFSAAGTAITFFLLMLTITMIFSTHEDFRKSQDPRYKSKKDFFVFYYREWPKMSIFFLMTIGVFLLSLVMDFALQEKGARILWCLTGIGIVFFSIRSIDTIVKFQTLRKTVDKKD